MKFKPSLDNCSSSWLLKFNISPCYLWYDIDTHRYFSAMYYWLIISVMNHQKKQQNGHRINYQFRYIKG